MELLTILLSGLLTFISPVGLVADQVAAGLIRDRLYQVDSLSVRIDNAPTFQLLGGRIERVRLAGRGVYPIPELRIAILDIETDPIDVDLPALRAGNVELDEPVQAAVHVVLNAEDINTLLRSERVQTLLDDLRFSLPGGTGREANRYGLTNPHLDVLADKRIRMTADLEDRVLVETVEVKLESGFEVRDGHRLVLLDPAISVDGQAVPQQLIMAFVDGIRSRLTLKQLESFGIVARVLQFELQAETLDVAMFVQVNPDSILLQED